jgi:hypothetical protein
MNSRRRDLVSRYCGTSSIEVVAEDKRIAGRV